MVTRRDVLISGLAAGVTGWFRGAIGSLQCLSQPATKVNFDAGRCVTLKLSIPMTSCSVFPFFPVVCLHAGDGVSGTARALLQGRVPRMRIAW